MVDQVFPDLMMDAETYGVTSTAAIIQLAVVPFNLETGEIAPVKPFDRKVELISSIANGGTVCQSTVDWWNTQDKYVHAEVTSGTESLPYVLHKLNTYMHDHCDSSTRIWSHATFDPVVLANAYKGCGIGQTASYWQYKDLRTLESLARMLNKAPIDKPTFMGSKHNALDDCMFQIQCADLWYRIIKRARNV